VRNDYKGRVGHVCDEKNLPPLLFFPFRKMASIVIVVVVVVVAVVTIAASVGLRS
jgi:hypothetical protein